VGRDCGRGGRENTDRHDKGSDETAWHATIHLRHAELFGEVMT